MCLWVVLPLIQVNLRLFELPLEIEHTWENSNLSLACTSVSFPEMGAAPSNPMPTSGASLMLFCFRRSSNAVKMLSALVNFKDTMSIKCSTGKPFSTQRQKN